MNGRLLLPDPDLIAKMQKDAFTVDPFQPIDYWDWEPYIQPRNDRVLIQRIEEEACANPRCGHQKFSHTYDATCDECDCPCFRKGIRLTDKPKSIKGIVLAVGPGKWHPGEWRSVSKRLREDMGYFLDTTKPMHQWIPGWREPCTVKPGDKVLFNSRWNDFAHAENVGTGSDGEGPLERPLPLGADSTLHLVQEADIFAIVSDFNFRASLGQPTLEKEHFINRVIAGPWSTP